MRKGCTHSKTGKDPCCALVSCRSLVIIIIIIIIHCCIVYARSTLVCLSCTLAKPDAERPLALRIHRCKASHC